MVNLTVRCGTLVALLALASACGDVARPTGPTSTPPAPTTDSTPSSPRAFPAVSRPARIYVAVHSPSYPMHGSPLASRYVLYDDGTFALQYSSANYPFFEYRGAYREANALITFEWEGWSVAGPWGATGKISDDALAVQYNLIMQLSDFEDGIYIRTE